MATVPCEPVVLPVLAPAHRELWDVLCDLADRHESDWVLVGGQMVLLHALQAGRTPHRVSQDLDAIIDARVRPPALAPFLVTLQALGFTSVGTSPDDVAHRYGRGEVHIDVLAPEGIGRRAPMRTVGTAVTVEIAGGTQALARGERLPVLHDGRRAFVPRPNLLGAIVIKAAAVNNDRQPQRHLTDLAFLVSMAGDPVALRGELTAKDLARLRAVVPLQNPSHEAWRLLEDPDEGFAAFRLLIG